MDANGVILLAMLGGLFFLIIGFLLMALAVMLGNIWATKWSQKRYPQTIQVVQQQRPVAQPRQDVASERATVGQAPLGRQAKWK